MERNKNTRTWLIIGGMSLFFAACSSTVSGIFEPGRQAQNPEGPLVDENPFEGKIRLKV
jgi:hypothetical protein